MVRPDTPHEGTPDTDSPDEPVEGAVDRPKTGGRNLPMAIGVGAVLGLAYIGTIVVHPMLFLCLVGGTVATAMYEIDASFAKTKASPPTIAGILALPIAIFGSYLHGTGAIFVSIIVGLVLGFLVTINTNADGHSVSRMAALSLMLLWLLVPASSTGLILAMDGGGILLIYITLINVIVDVGAYAVGRNFGRTPLVPSVSPNKTVEGLVGGVVFSAAVALLGVYIGPEVDVVTGLLLGLFVPLGAVLGDLAESLVKRDLGIKDMGDLLPGHGGIMDRIDGLLVSLPVGYVILFARGYGGDVPW